MFWFVQCTRSVNVQYIKLYRQLSFLSAKKNLQKPESVTVWSHWSWALLWPVQHEIAMFHVDRPMQQLYSRLIVPWFGSSVSYRDWLCDALLYVVERQCKMSSSQKLSCKGTLWQAFIWPRPRTPIPPPPLHTVYVHVYRILIHAGLGEGEEGELNIPTWLTVSPIYKFW